MAHRLLAGHIILLGRLEPQRARRTWHPFRPTSHLKKPSWERMLQRRLLHKQLARYAIIAQPCLGVGAVFY